MVRALVPATVYDLVHDDAIAPDSLASLREAGTGAAGLAETLRAAFEAKFGIRLSGSYGLSEAPAAVCSEHTGTPRRPGSSGMPLPHASITIRNPDGMHLSAGELGEIWIGPASDGPWAGQYRGNLGRWVDGGLVPSTGGEFATGDVGSLDDRGSLHVVGRTGDVITRGGVTVAAAEIEDVMGDFVGVRAAAVMGRPDDRLGERIVVFVEAEHGQSLDPADVRRQAATVLSHGKVPDEVIVLEALPRNAMGKVARAELPRDGVRE
jgi:acyl-CoA synthetase (AMP-forming)/AMP-acid ligase II